MMRLKEEYEMELRLLVNTPDINHRRSQKQSLQKRYFERFDEFLDTYAESPKHLGIPEIAQLVCDTFHYWNLKRYTLVCYCVMPNHIHLVIDVRKYIPQAYAAKQTYALSRIMESVKRYTARKSNEVLGRKGQFWQKESYDRVVRDGAELDQILRYVIENPVKAGLVDRWDRWKWAYFNSDYFIL
jgi:REP element-mobilizing transposase RayT